MIWLFMLGVFVVTFVVCKSTNVGSNSVSKSFKEKLSQEKLKEKLADLHSDLSIDYSANLKDGKTISSSDTVEQIEIPIEILPNLYSLELKHVSIKHHISHLHGKEWLNYVTLKGEIWYKLNGQRKGKRKIIVTSYDRNDKVIESCGNCTTYRFTDAGCEILEICFNNCQKDLPFRISILVREVLDDRTP